MAYINKINVDGVEYEVKDENALPAANLPEAINTALAQAKESGEFDGAQGPPGNDYVLTEADKQEIAELAAELVPSGGGGGASVGTLLKDVTLEADATLAITDFDTSLNEYHVIVYLPVGFNAATNINFFGSMGSDYYLKVDTSSNPAFLLLDYIVFAEGYFSMIRNTYTTVANQGTAVPSYPTTHGNAAIRSGTFSFTNRSAGLSSYTTFKAGTRIMIWGR